MPNARTANAVRLEFAPDSLVQTNLSGAAFTGEWLWVAGDEACALDRLRRRMHRPPATSVWLSTTMRTPPRRTAASSTSSRNGC
jgi:hypothetical protein